MPINGHEEVELALLSANLGNVEVEVADRVTLEGLIDLITGDLRQTVMNCRSFLPREYDEAIRRNDDFGGYRQSVHGGPVCDHTRAVASDARIDPVIVNVAVKHLVPFTA